ncbi:MAG: GTP-binding protein [Candidatus Lokiarchaeota archaeon]|nr:GTP-binding protein [Candidatus Lokiarchaeota archaeon]MBD3339802.1 GTP-binding protein [Candidatus Lokiarchaeota archaeon]
MKKRVLYKVLVAGDANVGKTTLVHRYVDGIFIDSATMTIGVEFVMEEIPINDVQVQLQIWDIGGQQRFRFMVEKYIPGAKGALLLFDTTNMTSFVNIEKWTKILRTHDESLPIILVATKCDLEEYSIVRDYYPELKQKKLNMLDYIKTSAKTGLNVEEVFKVLAKHLVNHSSP